MAEQLAKLIHREAQVKVITCTTLVPVSREAALTRSQILVAPEAILRRVHREAVILTVSHHTTFLQGASLITALQAGPIRLQEVNLTVLHNGLTVHLVTVHLQDHTARHRVAAVEEGQPVLLREGQDKVEIMNSYVKDPAKRYIFAGSSFW